MTEKPAKPAPARPARKLNGLIIFGALLLIMLVFSFRTAVTSIACDEAVLKTEPDVIMLGAWWCPYCAEARKYFHANNVHYCEYDIEHSNEGKRLYREANGGGIPILLIDNRKYTGFDARAFEKLMESRSGS